MKKIIMTKGLPGSGKTTWAKAYQKQNPDTVLVNKDDLRAMLHQNVWSKGREEFVLEIRNAIIIRSLEQGHDVIVHDTNLHPKHYLQMIEISRLTGFKGRVEVEVVDFTHVPLETCIKQDLMRFSSVGQKVIMDMYNQFMKPKPRVIEYDPNLPDAIICDIDGTLALFGNKNPYDRDFENDVLNIPVADIVRRYKRANIPVIMTSGRKDAYREQTLAWLHKYELIPAFLHMRKDGDTRKDFLVKAEIYEQHIKEKYNVLFVLDDRNQVVELWRSLGLTCLQVAEGDF